MRGEDPEIRQEDPATREADPEMWERIQRGERKEQLEKRMREEDPAKKE